MSRQRDRTGGTLVHGMAFWLALGNGERLRWAWVSPFLPRIESRMHVTVFASWLNDHVMTRVEGGGGGPTSHGAERLERARDRDLPRRHPGTRPGASVLQNLLHASSYVGETALLEEGCPWEYAHLRRDAATLDRLRSPTTQPSLSTARIPAGNCGVQLSPVPASSVVPMGLCPWRPATTRGTSRRPRAMPHPSPLTVGTRGLLLGLFLLVRQLLRTDSNGARQPDETLQWALPPRSCSPSPREVVSVLTVWPARSCFVDAASPVEMTDCYSWCL